MKKLFSIPLLLATCFLTFGGFITDQQINTNDFVIAGSVYSVNTNRFAVQNQGAAFTFLSLTAQTNRLSMFNGQLLFDGQAVQVGLTNSYNQLNIGQITVTNSISAGATNQWLLNGYFTNSVALSITNYLQVVVDGQTIKLGIVK